MKIIARHKWVAGATITESYDPDNPSYRRYTATIRGYRNWKIFEGHIGGSTVDNIIRDVTAIRNRIDAGDEDIFYLQNGYKKGGES